MSSAPFRRPLDSVWIAALAGVAYFLLSSADPRWGDSADLARRAVESSLAPFGRSYPMQSACVRVVSWLGCEPARASTIVSSLVGGVGVGLLHHILRGSLGCGRAAACGGAAAWAVSHTYWTAAVDGEPYGLLGLFTVAAIGAVLASRRSAVGALACGALVGLMPLHHRASLILAPVVLLAPIVLAPDARRMRAAAWAAAGLVIGALPFVVLLVATARSDPGGGSTAWWLEVLVGTPRNADLLLTSGRPLVPSLAYVAKWSAFCFPGIALPVAIAGLVWLRREDRACALVLVLVAALALVLPLRMGGVGDRYVFLAAAYPVVALLVGLGIEWSSRSRGAFWARSLALACAITPPVVYASLSHSGAGMRLLPGLNVAAMQDFFLPLRTGDCGSSAWLDDVSALLASEERVFAEWGAAAALEYAQQVDGELPGVRIVRRLPTTDDVDSAPLGVVIALTPIWAAEGDRLSELPGEPQRLGPGVYRVRPDRVR